MSDRDELPTNPDYVSVKDAAKILHTTDKMVYSYIDQGRIKAVKFSNFIVIHRSELEDFRHKPSGRPRTLIPKWRISSKDNAFYATSIKVNIISGRRLELLKKFEQIRKGELYEFPGTVDRYIMGSQQSPDQIEIMLIWKQAIMPGEDERERSLAAFGAALNDVLDWSTAQYTHHEIYMHT